MGWLRAFNPAARYDPAQLLKVWEQLRLAVNSLDLSNFPETLDGDTIITEGSLSPNRLSLLELGTFLAQATAYQTVSTSLVSIGKRIRFDPSLWTHAATEVYLDVTAGPTDVSGQTVVEVHGSAGNVLVTMTISAVGLAWSRQVFTSLPAAADTLTLKIKTTAGTSTAEILGASIVALPVV